MSPHIEGAEETMTSDIEEMSSDVEDTEGKTGTVYEGQTPIEKAKYALLGVAVIGWHDVVFDWAKCKSAALLSSVTFNSDRPLAR